MNTILDFPAALELVLGHAAKVRIPDPERVALLDSAGRVLAEEIKADRDQPPFNRSTRDGFAMHAAEWSAGQQLQVVGHSKVLRRDILRQGGGKAKPFTQAPRRKPP